MENFKLFGTKLLADLKKHQKIALFVHIHPDCDAIGSAFAFKNLIENNFGNKDVRIAGLNKLDLSYLPVFFQKEYRLVDEQFTSNAICILFDTANYERIFQKQLFNKKASYRIDHHLFVQEICKTELIDQQASSTCEMVAVLAQHLNWKINNTIASSLYFGLLTDTIRFLTPSTTKRTYNTMVYLLSNSNLDRQNVHNQLYLRSFDEMKLDQKFTRLLKRKNDFAYILFNKRISKKYDHNLLKQKLYLISNIKEIKIYALLYYDDVSKIYRCSLRSRAYNVNEIAKKFNGGGHVFASGCKIKNKAEFRLLEKEIIKTLNGPKYV